VRLRVRRGRPPEGNLGKGLPRGILLFHNDNLFLIDDAAYENRRCNRLNAKLGTSGCRVY